MPYPIHRHGHHAAHAVLPVARGFTLIELMVSMVIALVILAGMVGVFVSESRAHLTEVGRSEVVGDLGLVASIMRSELRQAKNVCWDAGTTTLAYQPLDSPVQIPPNCAIVNNSVNGQFKWVNAGAGGCSTSNTPCICWDRPAVSGGCQEISRNMSGTGLGASPSGFLRASPLGVLSVTLTGTFLDTNHSTRTARVNFKVWPRN